MRAVILAGGKGQRLREIVSDVPKPMAPVAERPFLEYIIMQLVKWDIRDIIISTGYMKEVIKSYFHGGEDFSARIRYSDEDDPLGTGGAVKKAAQMFSDESFIVMNGDSMLGLDFNRFIACYQEKKASAMVALASVDNADRYGRVEIDDYGTVLRFTEKGRKGPGSINGGVYVLSRHILDGIPGEKFSMEKDVLPELVGKGLYGMNVDGFFIDIGIPEDYIRLTRGAHKLLRTAEV